MSAPPPGRVALVTNGSSGLGAEIARTLAVAGATVAVGRKPGPSDDEHLPPQAASVHEGALGVPADCDRVVKEVVARHGRLDTVVCIAMRRGFAIDCPVELSEPAEWDRTINTYLSGPFYLIRAALGQMLDQGYGRIVTLVSTDGDRGSTGQTAQGVATQGLITLTRRLAREVAARGVTVNVVQCGLVASAWVNAELPPDLVEQLGETVPAGRLADPGEVANAVSFLCAPEAAYITGQVLGVDGGFRS